MQRQIVVEHRIDHPAAGPGADDDHVVPVVGHCWAPLGGCCRPYPAAVVGSPPTAQGATRGRAREREAHPLRVMPAGVVRRRSVTSSSRAASILGMTVARPSRRRPAPRRTSTGASPPVPCSVTPCAPALGPTRATASASGSRGPDPALLGVSADGRDRASSRPGEDRGHGSRGSARRVDRRLRARPLDQPGDLPPLQRLRCLRGGRMTAAVTRLGWCRTARTGC